FCLASLLTYLAYVRVERKFQLAVSLFCFALALLAKESAICLPFLVVAVSLFVEPVRKDGKTLGQFLKVVACYFSILLVFVAVRFVFIGSPSDCLETTTQSRTLLEVHIKPCAADADLFFFDKGRMTRLPDR